MGRLKKIESRYNASLEVSEEDFEWLIERAKCADRMAMMYENTGAMFNRMSMKEKIERYEIALKKCIEQDGLMKFLDDNDWAISEDYFSHLAKKALYNTGGL